METTLDQRPGYIRGTTTPIEYTAAGFPVFAIGGEMALIAVNELGKPSILMIIRGGEPFKGYFGLPAGHVEPHETTLQGALRETMEEVNIVLTEELVSFSHINSTPGRDPNKPCATTIHYHITNTPAQPTAGDDAASAHFIPLTESLSKPLSFSSKSDLIELYNNLAEKAYYDLGFFAKVLEGSTDEAVARFVKEIFDIADNPKYDIITLEKIVDNVIAYRSGFTIWE